DLRMHNENRDGTVEQTRLRGRVVGDAFARSRRLDTGNPRLHGPGQEIEDGTGTAKTQDCVRSFRATAIGVTAHEPAHIGCAGHARDVRGEKRVARETCFRRGTGYVEIGDE